MEMPTVPSSRLLSGFMVGLLKMDFQCLCGGSLVKSCFLFLDVLASTSEQDAPLQQHIRALCEAWWKKDLKKREKFGRAAFLISLKKSLTSKKPVSV